MVDEAVELVGHEYDSVSGEPPEPRGVVSCEEEFYDGEIEKWMPDDGDLDTPDGMP